ncbi:hypothetical protein [Bradyrhizobium vignae]|uniref:hypothetical protein n=1 Tax=Bradyrhizobium vignae TaxID=1549949 RepID=UPI00100AA36F|nr:hypothetical protein [Bradyrhizobium vignae]RXG92284.1 hypothetical protein EAV90_27250 [Bradyrhizobium vignae]
MTFSEVRTEVLQAVFNDRDRSLEGAVELAIEAGINFERTRLRAILSEITPRPGLEKVLIIRALDPESTVESVARFMAEFPVEQAHYISLRKTIKLVSDNSEQTKVGAP